MYQEKNETHLGEPHIFESKQIETLESKERKTWVKSRRNYSIAET